MRRVVVLLLLPVLIMLGGCATGPRYETRQVELGLVPLQVAANPQPYLGHRVLWGGPIVVTRNLPDYTEIEVLGYPLDRAQRPLTRREPQGRFLLRQAGYLEEIDYARGRLVTVTGVLAPAATGRIGEAPYTYPVVLAEELHLWPPAQRELAEPRFHIGIGVIFGR